jgi:hypothetical protein
LGFDPNQQKMGTSAPNEELCLRWNDFESILSRSFSEMRNELDFFDVRIACFDDKSVMRTIPAHKLVLSACSPVFKEILRNLGSDNVGGKGPLIFLRGIPYHDVEAVLDFMYNGQTKVQHKELDAFLAAAEDLKIKGLTSNTSSSSVASGEAGTPRKRTIDHDSVPRKGGVTKKSRPSIQSGATSNSGDNSHVEVKNEKFAEDEVEAIDEDTLDESSYHDYGDGDLPQYAEGFDADDGTGEPFPADSKGKSLFILMFPKFR